MNQWQHSTKSTRKTPESYLNQIEPRILNSLNAEQIHAIKSLLNQAIPKPSPKIVDLRFTVDLIISRFYVVLFVGRERRQGTRPYRVTGITTLGNIIAASLLLICLNLLITAFLFLLLYLIKSAVGINLFEGHLIDQIKKF
ncbi:MAG: hypothetical protein WBA13_16275 [Microcoleaceae cyanobacterium]